MTATLQPLDVLASETPYPADGRLHCGVFQYFPVFGIRIVRGRPFTAREADEGAALAIVSDATARTLWPGVDPIGQTLDLASSAGALSTSPDTHQRTGHRRR